MPVSKGIKDKALPNVEITQKYYLKLKRCAKKRRNIKKKKEEMNLLESMRCHSYPKQWPPFGNENL
jgi:hypothetical protein